MVRDKAAHDEVIRLPRGQIKDIHRSEIDLIRAIRCVSGDPDRLRAQVNAKEGRLQISFVRPSPNRPEQIAISTTNVEDCGSRPARLPPKNSP